MKYLFLSLILIIGLLECQGQTYTSKKITVTSHNEKTQVFSNENGTLQVNISPEDMAKFKSNGFVRYSEFGAKGDGKTDDINAIVATHAVANQQALMVKADEGFTYYISGKEYSVIIQTDTDFGRAKFIIDDTEVQNRQTPVFTVSSKLKPFKPEGITSLKKHQKNIGVLFPQSCLLTVTNRNRKRYFRLGLNQDNGSPQTDIFVVDKNGQVHQDTPILWDFDQITAISALPMDETTLTITGGYFMTIANQAESKYTYYKRGIIIKRSNVVVHGLEHRVKGEGVQGAPYRGFIDIQDCSNVVVKNTLLTGHKTYRTIGSVGKSVPMGSYDIAVQRALNVSFVNCKQTNDISNKTYWGIMNSNFSKNLLFDNCVFSRFDAHMGVSNATIRNSELGYMGIKIIGAGNLLVENSTIRGKSIIDLRSDYGSTWQGDLVIKNCIFIPREGEGKDKSVSLISGKNQGQHDFGYTCYMPENIMIDTLHIDDANLPESYKGPVVFSNFNKEMTDDSYQEKFPYVRTKKVIMKNVTTSSKMELTLSDNMIMFKNVTMKVY